MRDEHFDHELRGFLAEYAEDVGDAPTATDMAVRVSARIRRGTPAGLRLSTRPAWAVLAGLLLLALLGALVAGRFAPRPESGPLGYEAVFLRLEVIDAAPIVIVSGVNT